MAERTDNQYKFKTTVGGQAVMEGVMMKGPSRWCLAVRAPGGDIITEEHEITGNKPWKKWPLVRGVITFVESLLTGYSTLMRSAELSMTEEEQEEELSAFDKWIDKRFGEKGMNFIMAVSSVLGIALALGLFMFLPTLIVNLVNDHVIALGAFRTVLEGVLKICLFIVYLAAVRKSKDIYRVFSYHGAEHKTIFCYEAGEALRVENVRKHTRFHPRCGTSFILIVLVISILLNSLLPWGGSTLVRVGLKLLMLPVVMGVSYELLRLFARYDNPFTRACRAPGMWLQRLTTCEPDDGMIEVAIAAVRPVLPDDPDEAKW